MPRLHLTPRAGDSSQCFITQHDKPRALEHDPTVSYLPAQRPSAYGAAPRELAHIASPRTLAVDGDEIDRPLQRCKLGMALPDNTQPGRRDSNAIRLRRLPGLRQAGLASRSLGAVRDAFGNFRTVTRVRR